MNLLQISEALKGVPKQFLVQEATQPSGRYPQYMIVAELSRRTSMEKRFAMAEAQMPAQTVAEQKVAEATSPMPTPMTMAMGQTQPNMPSGMVPSEPRGRETMGMPAAVRMYEGGRIKMQEGGQASRFASNPAFIDYVLKRQTSMAKRGIYGFDRALPRSTIVSLIEKAEAAAKNAGIPDDKIDTYLSLLAQESAFHPFADSGSSKGIGQIRPSTAKEPGAGDYPTADKVKITDPDRIFNIDENLAFSAAYFKDSLDRVGGNTNLALAGYNAGGNKVARIVEELTVDGKPPSTQQVLNKIEEERKGRKNEKETTNYVANITGLTNEHSIAQPPSTEDVIAGIKTIPSDQVTNEGIQKLYTAPETTKFQVGTPQFTFEGSSYGLTPEAQQRIEREGIASKVVPKPETGYAAGFLPDEIFITDPNSGYKPPQDLSVPSRFNQAGIIDFPYFGRVRLFGRDDDKEYAAQQQASKEAAQKVIDRQAAELGVDPKVYAAERKRDIDKAMGEVPTVTLADSGSLNQMEVTKNIKAREQEVQDATKEANRIAQEDEKARRDALARRNLMPDTSTLGGGFTGDTILGQKQAETQVADKDADADTGTGAGIQSTLTKQINSLIGGGDKFMDVAGATKLLEKQREGLTNRSAEVGKNLDALNARLERQGKVIGSEALMAAGFNLMQGGNIGSAGEKALKQFAAARRELNKSKIAAQNAKNQFDLAMDARDRGDLKEARNYALQHNKAILERDKTATESIYKLTSLALKEDEIQKTFEAAIGRQGIKQSNLVNQRALKGLELQMKNLNEQLDRTFDPEKKAFLQSQIDSAFQRYQMLSLIPNLTIQTEDS